MPEPLTNPLEGLSTKREREREVATEIATKVFGENYGGIKGRRFFLKVGEFYYTVEVKEAGKKIA